MTDTPSTPKRRRRDSGALAARRQLAREAAEAGEALRQISRRLDIPRATLTVWAREDGFRKQDIAARQAEAARAEADADAVRRRAEEAVQRMAPDEAEADDPSAAPSATDTEITLARARVGALLEAGFIPEAEQDMRAARRLTSLASFAAPARAATEAATRQAQYEESNACLLYTSPSPRD